MKKILMICLSLALTVGLLAACGGGGSTGGSSAGSASQPDASGSNAPSGDGLRIGIIQLAPHPALDAACEGFIDGLAEAGYVDGDNITIDVQNAQGEIANCPTIAAKLVNDQCDLILAIATPAAQAVAEKTSDIPILVTAVTDPAESKLVNSNEAPGGNVTGTSDLTPVAEQLELLQTLVPEAKKVGFLYCSSEANSLIQINIAKEAADKLGLEYEEFTVSNTNELQSVVTSMVGKVDAIYTPTDNTIANAVSTVAAIATENKIPYIVGEENMVDGGGLASVSINYYDLGQITAQQAVEILSGESAPAEMPIRYQENFQNVFNLDTAAAIGVTIPEDLQ